MGLYSGQLEIKDLTAGLARKVDELEMKYDKQFKVVFDAVRKLMSYSPPSNQVEGFQGKTS